MRKGFSLVELIFVVVIVGLISLFGIPNFSRQIERQKAQRAEGNLRIVYNVQRAFWIQNAQYFPPNCQSLLASDLNKINTNLMTLITDSEFVYTITPVCSSAGTTIGYELSARRNGGGMCAGKIMTMTEKGGEPSATCQVWGF